MSTTTISLELDERLLAEARRQFAQFMGERADGDRRETSSVFPWLRHLDDRERQEFIRAYIETLVLVIVSAIDHRMNSTAAMENPLKRVRSFPNTF